MANDDLAAEFALEFQTNTKLRSFTFGEVSLNELRSFVNGIASMKLRELGIVSTDLAASTSEGKARLLQNVSRKTLTSVLLL